MDISLFLYSLKYKTIEISLNQRLDYHFQALESGYYATLYKDLESAKQFAEKALKYQSENHPNKITRVLYLLLNDKLEEAEEWQKTIRPDSVEVETARDLIKNYKSGGPLNIIS